MRFQFCGNIACPEWFIAEISVLTKITAIKMKLVFNQLIAHYLQSPSQSETASSEISSKITKLLNNTGLDIYEINAVVSTLNFILHNSVRFHATDITLQKELIDLGLPKQNIESITKSFKGNRQKLLQKATEHMYRGSSLGTLQYSIHQFLGSQRIGSKSIRPIKFIELQLEQKNPRIHPKQQPQKETKKHNFVVCESELDELIHQLEEAISFHDKIESTK